jgi:hypothetical protein
MKLFKTTVARYRAIAALATFAVASLAAAQTGYLQWMRAGPGHPVPGGFVGGTEKGRPLIVCRGPYSSGVYPGKLVNGICDISFGNKEVSLDDYEVLVGVGGQWGPPQADYAGAFVAGGENGGPLFLCQSPYEGGVHPGKIYDNSCHISYGGREVPVQGFNVLYLGVPTVAGAFNYPLPPPWASAGSTIPPAASLPMSGAARLPSPVAASCTADATKYCAGCSVTCSNPEEPRPHCQDGLDTASESSLFKCLQASWCYCTR